MKYENAKNSIADKWNEDPSRASRQISYELKKDSYRISRKKIGELMREIGLRSLFVKPNLSMPDKQHKKYPYLLIGVTITHSNHVLSTDITYIKLGLGHVYLTAIIDWYSRKVLSGRLSNTLYNIFCIDAFYEALCKYGNLIYSILVKAHSTQQAILSKFWKTMISRSAWTVKVELLIMFISKYYGEQ